MTALFLSLATACFLAALVAAAAMHFLFVQDLLSWVAFALLLALALCFGLLGWKVVSILRTAVRRTVGVLPDEDAGPRQPQAATPPPPAPLSGSDPAPHRLPRGSTC